MQQQARKQTELGLPDLREDALHFRSGTVPVTVQITPHRRKTPMGDLVLRGFIGGKEIEVVFPGRRQAAAVPLLQRLHAQIQKHKLHQKDKSASGTARVGRYELKVDGAWRVRLMNEQDAKPERRFQLVAARWRFKGSDGLDHVFGHLPN
ncbi:MAG: hypothetical protein AAF222_10985 [Pseudomonadota bacterium]